MFASSDISKGLCHFELGFTFMHILCRLPKIVLSGLDNDDVHIKIKNLDFYYGEQNRCYFVEASSPSGVNAEKLWSRIPVPMAAATFVASPS